MEFKNPWQTLNSRIIYENPWIRLREDVVIRPDGKSGIYGVVELKPSIGVVVLNEGDEIALVGQWRYAHNKYSWEIPTGGSAKGDETILDAAKRELKEETGISAKKWTSLGSIDNSNGATTDVANLFFATELDISEAELEAEEDIITKWVPFYQAVDMVMQGNITESCSVAGILKVDKIRSTRGEDAGSALDVGQK